MHGRRDCSGLNKSINDRKHLLDSNSHRSYADNKKDFDSQADDDDSNGKFPDFGGNNNNTFSFGGDNSNGGNNNANGNGENNDSDDSNGNNGSNTKMLSPPRGNGCQFVNENDGRLQYTGRWTLEAKDPTGLTTTTHTTTTTGSQVSIVFNGTAIIVIGIVHPSNSTSPPPVASYTIDTSNPTELPLPVATHNIPNQQFFQSPQLSPGEHTLLINVTSAGSPYTLDYLFFCGNSTPSVAAASVQEKTEDTGLLPRKTAIIIGGILGACMIILLLALIFVLCGIRKRRSRAAHTRNGPLREWLSRQTMFTSSESIMRNNPSNSTTSAADSREKPASSTMETQKPLPKGPVIRTFSDFDRHYSFPFSLDSVDRDDVPNSPGSGSQRRISPNPPVPPKGPVPF